ncbi:hypothetical protein PR048_025333 [Dryococelus australis]|uniref:DDE-1 domain-containing protein n=1 Tax=Dryococelus australis TaxID=614101 RepID=A0ABQ9GR15_9NEOP|nr:hypothetical protein PR048_025333 [Dryococelus australis]
MVHEYFGMLEKALEDVTEMHIFNFDETNLTDDPGQSKIILRHGTKYPHKILNSSKSAVSLMFCRSAGGDILPPYVVIGKQSCRVGNSGGKGTTIDKQYFPYLLINLWDAVTPQIGSNLKAGFERCGIVPIALDKIMRIVENPEIDNKSLQASFIEALGKKLQEMAGLPKPGKRKRINVMPGKSVDEDVLATEDDGALRIVLLNILQTKAEKRGNL